MSNMDLLTQALERATLARDPNSPVRTSRRGRPRNAPGSENAEESDEDELVGVKTPLTPASQSRSTSPTRTGSRMAERRRQRELEAQTSHDPLRRLPNELSTRIFLQLRPRDLGVCMRVCKKWRKSQTINYCWYVLQQKATFLDTMTAKPTWTRNESKQDWAARYKSVHRRDDLEYAYAADADYERARSDGYRTPREEREARWAEENADSGGASASKAELREYYKGLKNAKGSKGALRGARDRTEAWDD